MQKKEFRLVGVMVTMVGALLMSGVVISCGPSDGARKQPTTTGERYQRHETEPGQDTPADQGEMHEEQNVPGEPGPGETAPEGDQPGTPEPGTPGSGDVNTGDQNEPGLGESGESDGKNVSDDEIAVFARVYMDVRPIQLNLENEMRKAAGRDEARKLHTKAKEKVDVVLKRHGVTMTSYQKFFEQLSRSRDLQQRFNLQLKKLSEASEGGLK